MTEQEHIEVSRKLAIAIGWKPEQMTFYDTQGYIGLPVVIAGRQCIKLFDYRFESIAFRVAERYKLRVSFRDSIAWREGMKCGVMGITPQLAIALAVIAAQGVK